MNCAEFRERLLVDPGDPRLKAAAEADVCPDARLQLARASAFERRLLQALEVEVPADLEESVQQALARERALGRRTLRHGWLALAASITLGAFLGAWFWRGAEADATAALADACVAHLVHEPYAITRTRDVPPALVERLFMESGVALRAAPVAVQYGQPCKVSGRTTLHMVAQESSGPVTVLYVTDPPELERRDFRQSAVVGRVVPMGSGALVLLAEHNEDFDQLEQGFRTAIEGAAVAAAGTI